jgi:uncharacterized membrane protein YfcA
MKVIALIVLGLASGALSGVTGMGGGAVIVPALIYVFGYSVHLAQGTTLALLVPPIGLLAAWAYFKSGYVDIPAAMIIALGFVIGSFIAAKIAVRLPTIIVRKIFAVALGLIAFEMFFHPPQS